MGIVKKIYQLFYSSALFLSALWIVPENASAQTGNQGPSNTLEQRIPEPAKARPGTYRFIVNPGGEQEAFTDDVLVIAEQLRQDHQTVRHQLSSFVTIEIFSRDHVKEQQQTSLHTTNEIPVSNEK